MEQNIRKFLLFFSRLFIPTFNTKYSVSRNLMLKLVWEGILISTQQISSEVEKTD